MIIIDEGERREYTIRVGESHFGFVDVTEERLLGPTTRTEATLGPLGSHAVPCSAKVGWGIVLAIALLLAALIGRMTFSIRRRKISPATR